MKHDRDMTRRLRGFALGIDLIREGLKMIKIVRMKM